MKPHISSVTFAEQIEALRSGVGFRCLDHYRSIEVRGDDAGEWLNGQLTNQVATLQAGEAGYALIVSLKGRVLSDCWVLRNEHWRLLMPASVVPSVVERFEQYIIMEDVELETQPLTILSLQGPKATEIAASVGAQAWNIDRIRASGVELIFTGEQVQAELERAMQRLAEQNVPEISEQVWHALRVHNGIPEFGTDFGDWTYPQEAGVEKRAVSFDKGCYLGQEAVVMLEHRGKPPKRLCQLRLEASAEAETEIALPSGEVVGELSSCVPALDGQGNLGLGLLKHKHATPNSEVLVANQKARILTIVGEA